MKDVSNGTLIDNRINKLRQKYLHYDDEINREPITVQKLVLSKADKQYFEDLIEARECTERRDSHRRINGLQGFCCLILLPYKESTVAIEPKVQ